MRTAPRRFQGGGGGGRGGGRRDISPHLRTSKTRDHHRHRDGEWQHDPYRSRRSPSPQMRDRPRQPSPAIPHRSGSIERRRGYGSVSSRVLDNGKLHHEHPHPLSSHTHGNYPAMVFDDADGGLRHKYILPDSQPDKHVEMSRAIRSKELHHTLNGGIPSSSAGDGLDGNEMLVSKPMYLDDGSVRTFFTLPLDPGSYASGSTTALGSNSIGRIGGGRNTSRTGLVGEEEIRYLDCVNERYDEGEKQRIYSNSRDAPYPGQRAFGGGVSSSGLLKDDFSHSYQDAVHLSPKGFGKTSGLSKFRDDRLGHEEYNPMQFFDPVKRRALSPSVRGDSRDYSYPDVVRLERRDRGLPASEEYKQVSWGPRGEVLHSSFMNSVGCRVGEPESSPRIMRNPSLWEHSSSLERDSISDYHGMKKAQEGYISGTAPLGFRSIPPQDREFPHIGESYDYQREDGLEGYRGRSRSPLLSERFADIYRGDVSPSCRRGHREDLDVYDPPSDRVLLRRRYITDEDMDDVNPRSWFPTTRNDVRRIVESGDDDELWTTEDLTDLDSSRRFGFARPQSKMLSRRISGSGVRLSHPASEGGSGLSLKKRLRPDPSNYHGSFLFNKRQDFYKPYKLWKKNLENQHGDRSGHDVDVQEDVIHVKRDPPEDSEEFKQQVHKAFLSFSKVLNENSHHQKRYREQGKGGSLTCCVCGSLSKDFVDTHSLIMHSYNSSKAGLRTDHLGLHKALCFLMGWNWSMAPDNARIYQSRPVPEVNALREDLILWPPLVIIHNSSIGNKNITSGPKIVNNEGMEEILKGIGVGAGKARVCRGKPKNQSIMLVKFPPTFSGLQEAEKLHKYYADNKRGRKEFQEISSLSGNSVSQSEVQVEELLYAYIGIAEDLDKLDPETKKRCVVKSKKDIEAIADAPFNS